MRIQSHPFENDFQSVDSSDQITENTERNTEPLNENQRDLATKYMPYALSIARKFSAGWQWMLDEMESVALLALVEAARNFDPSFNVKFPTYLRRRLIGSLLDARRKICQSYKLPSDEENDFNVENQNWHSVKPISGLNVDEITDLETKIANDSDRHEDGPLWVVRDSLEKAFITLPNRHRQVMSALYLDHLSLDEIASQYGCSKSRLIVVHRESINMLINNHASTRQQTKRRRKRRVFDPGFSSKTEPDLNWDE